MNDLVRIIQEHTLYQRLLNDLLIIAVSKTPTKTQEYPFEGAHALVQAILNLKEKADKYDALSSGSLTP